jgi:serralysin
MRKVLFVTALFLSQFCVGQEAEKARTPIHLCTMMGEIEPPHQIVGEGTLLWQKKKVSVYFMDGDGSEQRVLSVANEWRNYSGVQFIRSWEERSADIRVSFRTDGWWSHIGSYALEVGKDSATMSLDSLYLYPPAKFRSVVLHEFGHALGLLHEHQHKFLDIKWNFNALYAYYRKNYDVDSNWVKENVLEKYESPTAKNCTPDLHSIMIYEIPPGLTTDGLVVIEPLTLSDLDKRNIQRIYTNQPCN